MIRPATCLAMLMAAASGLYLYQTKHQGYVLDRRIEEVAKQTAKIRDHIAVLRAEYALLNDPSRLQDLAGAHLPGLAPLAPGQFTTLAQLDQRLPPVAAPAPGAAAPPEVSAAPAIGVSTGDTPYDFPPAPARQADPRALLAGLAAPARAAPAAVPARAAASHRPRAAGYAAGYASVIRPAALRRAPAFAQAARPDPLAIQAAAPAFPGPPQVASALGMARGLVAPSAVSYQRYQPGGAETLSR